MASELRKTILELEDTVTEVVTIPEWNGGLKIEVRSMSGQDRSRLLKRVTHPVTNEVDQEKWIPELVIAVSFDPETGERIFEEADRESIAKKNGAALQRIMEVGTRLSGLGEPDVVEAKELFDDAQKSAST